MYRDLPSVLPEDPVPHDARLRSNSPSDMPRSENDEFRCAGVGLRTDHIGCQPAYRPVIAGDLNVLETGLRNGVVLAHRRRTKFRMHDVGMAVIELYLERLGDVVCLVTRSFVGYDRKSGDPLTRSRVFGGRWR